MDDGFGHWLAGFVDGEGCFYIYRQLGGSYSCRLTIHLRIDDAAVLSEIQRQTGIGTIRTRRPYGGSRWSMYWTAGSKAAALGIVEIFDRYPLRAKKAADYRVWRMAVMEWARLAGRPRADYGRMEALKRELETGRSFDDEVVVADLLDDRQIALIPACGDEAA